METVENKDLKSEVVFEGGRWWVQYRKNGRRHVSNNPRNNALRMYVDGNYIPKHHPLWKAGHYRSFNDAAFSALTNYKRSTVGDVYIITNDAWPRWLKVGKAIDAKDRLKSYQTGDPLRSYTLRYSSSTDNRHIAETEAHKALTILCEERNNEWFKMDLSLAINCLRQEAKSNEV